jgi:hypothetical protein
MPRKTRAERSEYYFANKEHIAIVAKQWRLNNKPLLAALSKKHHDRNRKKRENADRLRNTGVTPEQFEKKLAEQCGCCGLCGFPFLVGEAAPRADHDHTTGEFRGVLHRHCNLGLGTFRDNIELLEYAVTYLRKFERRTH